MFAILICIKQTLMFSNTVANCLTLSHFNPEDRGDTFLWNLDNHPRYYTASKKEQINSKLQ